MDIKNKEIFESALKTLNDNERKTLEAFAKYILISGNSVLDQKNDKAPALLDKANDLLLKDYITFNVTDIIWNFDKTVSFFLEGRDKPLTFPEQWFFIGGNNLTSNVKSLSVKFRPLSNRIDKVAFDSKLLTELGKTEGKKRILALNANVTTASVPKSGESLLEKILVEVNTPQTSNQFVQKIINAASDGWVNTPASAQISVPKSNAIFSKLDSFKEGRLRLSRVGEILFNELDRLNNKKYTWDSEFFFGSPHDFTNVKTGKTYDIKCHFHPGERLQLSQQTLNKCDADFIVSVMVEEDSSSYTATVVGYITKADFTAKTKPWAYNEYVELRSLELHELNSPKDLI